MDTMKKIAGRVWRYLTWALVAFTVLMMVFTVVTVSTVDKNERSIFGIKFYIVQSDSMSLSENNRDLDVHFDAGDIVMIKKSPDPTALQVGDVIAFMSTNSASYGETVTHRIHEVKTNAEGRVLGYMTYGTNTGTLDEAMVEPEYILGQYAGRLVGVGRFFAFLKSTVGYVICILIPFLLLILHNGVNVVRLYRRYRGEQLAAIEQEAAQLAEERAQNQRMMAQLLALKAQFDLDGVRQTDTEPASAVPDKCGESLLDVSRESALHKSQPHY